MCTYYYLHYHHVAPCSRAVECLIHYSFCPNATTDTLYTTSGSSTDDQQYQQPCSELVPAPECDPATYTNPCASGGCLVSQHCASGGCRLEELGGRWICCRCSRGGNTFRWCMHPVRKVPDALCYHVVCRECRMDA